MDKKYISINKKLLFSISIDANFFKGGKYNFETKTFTFLGKSKESLYLYIISNKINLRNFLKSKRNRNNTLLIRKNDDLDFLANNVFSIMNVKNITNDSGIITLLSDNVFFTDMGVMSLKEWMSKNEELFI